MNNERLTAKLNEIFKDDDALEKFLTYMLIHHKEILSTVIFEDEVYKDINDIVRIEDNIEDKITIIVDCKELGMKEGHEDKLIVEIKLSIKLTEDNTFSVIRRDVMMTNDGEALYASEYAAKKLGITEISQKEYLVKIFKY